ncbi:MAG: CbtB domain-containing protein [Thermoleophilaceae bacterium]
MDGTIALPQPSLRDVSVWVWVVLGVALFMIFAVGYDQGQTLSVFMGKLASANNYLHEFFHDGRHLLGFPCH